MAILTFLIDALVIFTAIRIARNAQKKLKASTESLKEKMKKEGEEEAEAEAVEETVEEEPVAEPEPVVEPVQEALSSDAVALLAEIRDLLKAEKSDTEAK